MRDTYLDVLSRVQIRFELAPSREQSCPPPTSTKTTARSIPAASDAAATTELNANARVMHPQSL